MKVFSSDSRTVEMWGPTASVKVLSGALKNTDSEDWLLTNFAIGAKEIVDVRQCFDDVSYIYAMGNNQSECEITMVFAIFIGRKNCKGKSNLEALKRGMDAYVERRISQNI